MLVGKGTSNFWPRKPSPGGQPDPDHSDFRRDGAAGLGLFDGKSELEPAEDCASPKGWPLQAEGIVDLGLFLGWNLERRHAQGRLLAVPRSGQMLEGNFKSAPLAGGQRHGRRAQHPARFPQDHLIQVVGEFQG